MQAERSMIDVIEAVDAGAIASVRTLFQEYGEWLSDQICLSGFAEEVDSLPGPYSPPAGRLLLAKAGGEPLGCVGLRPLSAEVGEVKRLYVRQSARGRGVGRALMNGVVRAAKDAGYRLLRLDSLADRMQTAIALYRQLGFVEIEAYYDGASERKLYFELNLRRSPGLIAEQSDGVVEAI